MKRNKILNLSVIIAELLWYMMFSFINDTPNYINWNLASVISFSLLTLLNTHYYFIEKNKE